MVKDVNRSLLAVNQYYTQLSTFESDIGILRFNYRIFFHQPFIKFGYGFRHQAYAKNFCRESIGLQNKQSDNNPIKLG